MQTLQCMNCLNIKHRLIYTHIPLSIKVLLPPSVESIQMMSRIELKRIDLIADKSACGV